jgi:hypothetical protein
MPDTLPPFPDIDSLDWSPPSQTGGVEVSRSTGPLVIFADSDNSGYQDNVWDQANTNEGVTPRINNWWDGNEPAARQFVVRKYWKLVPGTFTHLSSGTGFTKSWDYTHGVSTTDPQSITAQLGISGDGLSASLSATLGHSVTINDQQSTTTQYTVTAPESGTRVWMLWDLMYQFMIVRTGSNNTIPAGTYRGDVDFSGDDHYSGAYLNYRWTDLIVSAGIICPQDKIFT